MNIFMTDPDPTIAAQSLCDRHVVKMVLESAQLLSSARPKAKGYKPTHLNHPCTQWVSKTDSNYQWLFNHFQALAEEYTYRYAKEHLSWTKLHTVLRPAEKAEKAEKDITPPALAMPDEYKVSDCPYTNYRNYYRLAKATQTWCKWERNREQPNWALVP